MPYFRPQPVMTVLAVLGLSVLCALGWWQVQRLEWKLDLIAAVEARTNDAPQPLVQVLDMTPSSDWEYTPVAVEGTFDTANELHVFGQNLDGQIGWFLFTPLMHTGHGPVIVNRGFVPQDLKDPALRNDDEVPGEVVVIGLLRNSSRGNAFTPAANIDGNEWYARDVPEMAAALGLSGVPPVYIDVTETIPARTGEWPQMGQTRLAFTNNHLGYALTWFGLALTLIGVYVAFHWQTGRLGPRANS